MKHTLFFGVFVTLVFTLLPESVLSMEEKQPSAEVQGKRKRTILASTADRERQTVITPIKTRKLSESDEYEATHIPEHETILDIENLEQTTIPKQDKEIDIALLEETRIEDNATLEQELLRQSDLIKAVLHNQPELAELSLRHGALAAAEDAAGLPLLLVAVKNKNKKMTDLLINFGADLNAKDNQGNSPLLASVLGGLEDIAHTLLEKGAKVNIKNEVGLTPLMGAVINNKPNLVKLLLNHHASIHDADTYGFTALNLATENPVLLELLNQALYQRRQR